MIIFYIISCSSNYCDVERAIDELKSRSEFDYRDFSATLLDYLHAEGKLLELNKKSVIEYLENEKYCELKYKKFVNNHETFAGSSPMIGYCLASNICENKDQLEKILESENFILDLVEALKSKDEEFFKEPLSGYIISYYTDSMFGNCSE